MFDLIHHHGYAIWHGNHLIRNFTTDAVYKQLGLQKATDSTLNIISGIQGYASKSIVKEKIIDTAFQLADDERMLRPSVDCIDNRHEQSLLSLLVRLNGLRTFEAEPMIQQMITSEQKKIQKETIYYLSRHAGIGIHDIHLVRKSVI